MSKAAFYCRCRPATPCRTGHPASTDRGIFESDRNAWSDALEIAGDGAPSKSFFSFFPFSLFLTRIGYRRRHGAGWLFA